MYGQGYNSDVARRMMYGSYRTLQKMDEDVESRVVSEGDSVSKSVEAQLFEMRKERQRIFDERSALNKVVRDRARQEELNDIISSAIMNNKTLPLLCHDGKQLTTNTSGENDLLVSLNDIHYGANVDNYWCCYNSTVCSQMIERYVEKIIAIGALHRSENCIIWANGDMISGNIHYQIAVSNNENLIEQVIGVSELIAQFIDALRPHFSNVKFVSVAGNHSRVDQKDKSLLGERLDDLIGWYLKARMACCDDVQIEFGARIDPTMYLINVRGKNYVGVHGDYDPTPAHIQTLQAMAECPVYAVLLGHKHHNKQETVQGIRTIMSGSFLGMDDFCVQRRIYGRPEQLVCVCDSSGIVCSYDIDLSTK